MLDAQGSIEEEEEDRIRSLIIELVTNSYFNRNRFRFDEDSLILDLLKPDYELTEFSNYFFSALKAFIMLLSFCLICLIN